MKKSAQQTRQSMLSYEYLEQEFDGVREWLVMEGDISLDVENQNKHKGDVIRHVQHVMKTNTLLQRTLGMEKTPDETQAACIRFQMAEELFRRFSVHEKPIARAWRDCRQSVVVFVKHLTFFPLRNMSFRTAFAGTPSNENISSL